MAIDVIEQMRVAFRAEALDLLIELDSALLELESHPDNTKLLNRVFRAIHTIKGSGGTAGFTQLAAFAHNVEEAFDQARSARLAVTPELIDCGLKACDVIRLLIERKAETGEVAGEAEVTRAFRKLLPESAPAAAGRAAPGQPDTELRSAFEIVFRPLPGIFYSGADPVTLLDELRELGAAHVTAHCDRLPALTALDAEHCYLWWRILLVCDCDLAAIQNVFVFVEDECEVRIRLLDDQAGTVALLGSVPAEAFGLFRAECEDHIERIEDDALALEEDPAASGRLDSLFRGIHSIKGNAGLLLGQVSGSALTPCHPLRVLQRVAHGLESLLDPFRSADERAVPQRAIQTALETCDALRTLVGCLTHNGAGGPVLPELLERLGAAPETSAETPALNERDAAFRNTASQCVEMIEGCLRRVEPDGALPADVLAAYRRGLKTLSAAARYQQRDELAEPLALQLRILEAVTASGAALGSDQHAALGHAFRLVRSILGPAAGGAEAGAATEPAAVSKRAAAPRTERPVAPSGPSTIRIEQDKLDRLMRVVGELLVARGAFPLLVEKLAEESTARSATKEIAKEVKEAGSNISRIADELQASVMSIRMLPVKTVFQRFPRLVRDLARSLGKDVRLAIEGENIELDKTIIEQIGDPLVHVIRNAVDHGIEAPAERLAAGKSASGQVTLRAMHDAGGVLIETTDDGRGLDASLLKRKAVEKGLITSEAAAAMSDEAAYQLVFLPGLTTAAKLSDVSGRGVGMDVVRSNVRNLQGTIEIRSRPGVGTTFSIKLPTSLMISKGILLEAGGQEYILPLSNIHDMVKLPSETAHRHRGLTIAQVRGTTYPIFNLAAMLGFAATEKPEMAIAIVATGAMKYGLTVDKFLSEVEVLVKPLTGGLALCKEYQGAAIMGDGRVVLVLNPLECHYLVRSACA